MNIPDNALLTVSINEADYENNINTNLPKELLGKYREAKLSNNQKDIVIYSNIAFIYKLQNPYLIKTIEYLDCAYDVGLFMMETKNPIIALFDFVRHKIVSLITEKGDEWEHLFSWLKIMPFINNNWDWATYYFLDEEDYKVWMELKYMIKDVIEENKKLFTFFDKHLVSDNILQK